MRAIISLLTGLLTISSLAETNTTAAGATPLQEPVPEDYPYTLPFMAQKAIDIGEELPLPFGISLAYYFVQRDIEVSSVKASINDFPVTSVDNLADFDVRTTVHTGTMRLDTWIFPFLNVYGIAGHVDNTSAIKARFNLPDGSGGTTTYTLNADGGFKGTTVGYGTVLAAGYDDFFMTLDANWIYTELGDAFDTHFDGQIYNARAGWKGKFDGHHTRIWLGVAYWDTERSMSGTIYVNEDNPLNPLRKVNFEVVQGPVNPVTYSMGINYEFTDHLNVVADIGTNLDDATTILLSLNYRLP